MTRLNFGNSGRNKAVLITMLATLILSAGPAAAGAAGESVVVRVPTQARAQVTAAQVRPALDLDYGSFHWLEVKAADLARLAARGVPHTVVPDARQVRVPGFRFDPLAEGEPKLPPDRLADPSRPGLRLVQLVGPAQESWLPRLAGAGARILQYYPHNTYLVWAGPAAGDAVRSLEFVRWQGLFHPDYKVNADLVGRTGKINNVDVMFYDDGDRQATLDAITRLGGEILQVNPSQPDKAFYDAIVRLDAGAVQPLATVGTVLWMGYESPRPTLDDEMSDQIVAGNHPGGVPVTGYQSHLTGLGVDGTGVTWAVIDTGVDYNHPDLGPHIVGGSSFPGIPAGCDPGTTPGADCSNGGHGTHVAGIIGGDATAGFTDAGGFLYGLGMAPEYNIFAMNSLSAPAWPPAGGWQEHSRRAVLGGAVGGNNSWTTGEGTAHGYQASERTHDLMVRDGNFDTGAVAEPFIEVFSAGNSGPGAMTLTAPHEAKNLITVASSQNFRIGSIDNISSFSSRGPAVDGRWVPTITAPGEQIASSRNDVGGVCATPIGGTSNFYAFCSGTSMASPHAAGAVVLLTEWWRGLTEGGVDPSPAFAKALLVNGAVDMGTANIPNANEGWGRINITNVITPAAPAEYWDQTTTFGATGEDFQVTVGVPNPGLPVKVSLVWTDAAGAVGANPALVNNLDLTVVDGANTYLGNRFTAGWSVTGGTPDTLNNVENVFIQSPGGSIDLTVAATAVNGDGVPYNPDTTDQDFALVCSNCALTPDFTLDVDPSELAVCAPANAVYTVSVGSILSFTDPVTLAASGNPAGTSVGFTTNPVTPPGSSTLTISNTGSAVAGAYTIQVDGTSTTGTKSRMVGLDLFTAAPSTVTLLTPANAATNQPVQPTFTWNAVSELGTYTIEVASDPAFTSIVETASGIEATTYVMTGTLNTNTTYYWRVRASNACGTGSFSAARSFTTVPGPGDCPIGATAVQTFTDGFETGAAGWTHSGTGDSWALSGVRVHGGANSFHANTPGSVTDQFLVSPSIALPSGSLPQSLKFWNHQTLEDNPPGCYDGAVLEISTNGGGSWTRLEAQLLTDPYDGVVSGCCANPIAASNAWCGDPQDWTNSIVDISAFAGQTVKFRFRVATDTSVSREGWYIDDVSVQACSSLIFQDGFESGNTAAWGFTTP